VTLRARWVTLTPRWVTLRSCWVTFTQDNAATARFHIIESGHVSVRLEHSTREVWSLLPSTATPKLRSVTLGLAWGDRKWSLNDGQILNFPGVRVHVSTGYNRVEGGRRA
jgi:hypothetical protein